MEKIYNMLCDGFVWVGVVAFTLGWVALCTSVLWVPVLILLIALKVLL